MDRGAWWAAVYGVAQSQTQLKQLSSSSSSYDGSIGTTPALLLTPSTAPAHSWSSVRRMMLVLKNLPASAGDIRDSGSITGSRRSPGEGNGNLLQYSCLENSVDRGACQATIFRVSKSQTRLRQLSTNKTPWGWACSPGAGRNVQLMLPRCSCQSANQTPTLAA